MNYSWPSIISQSLDYYSLITLQEEPGYVREYMDADVLDKYKVNGVFGKKGAINSKCENFKREFDPDYELSISKKLPILLFMKFYCLGRFLGLDKYCNRYKEQGCDLGYAFKKDEGKTCKKLAFYKDFGCFFRRSARNPHRGGCN